MGIRFLCHHCNARLNVKTSQAGQEGRCPSCHGEIRVPKDSTFFAELDRQRDVKSRPGQHSRTQDSSIGLYDIDAQITVEGLPAEKRATSQSRTNDRFGPQPAPSNPESNPRDASSFMLAKPRLPETLGKIDPIAESPNRIWYFRSRELGEKGPLKGKLMQEFLERGDICVGCIVWRDDWNDWIPAEKVFPSLVAEVKRMRKTERLTRAFKQANYAIPKDLDIYSERNRKQQRKHRIFLIAIVSGVVMIVVLLVVLLKLISTNS